MTKGVPPVEQRPRVSREDLNRLIDRRRYPEHDKTAPNGDQYWCIGRWRREDARLIYQKQSPKRSNRMVVQAGYEQTPHGRLYAISASYPGHYPSWEELKRLRSLFFRQEWPVMMVFPDSQTVYINDHPYCLWLWQMPVDTWGWPSTDPVTAAQELGLTLIHGPEETR